MKFKLAQKFRIIVSGVSVYTTAKQIRLGVGDQTRTNAAVYAAFTSLQNMKSQENATVGLCARYNDIDVQINTL